MFVKVHLADVLPECLERSTGVLPSYIKVSVKLLVEKK